MEEVVLEYDTNASTDLVSTDYLSYASTTVQTLYLALLANQGHKLENPQTEYYYLDEPLHAPSSTLLKLQSECYIEGPFCFNGFYFDKGAPFSITGLRQWALVLTHIQLTTPLTSH